MKPDKFLNLYHAHLPVPCKHLSFFLAAMPPKIGGAAANKAAPKGMTPAEKKKQKIDNKAKANPGAAAANKEKSDAKRARSPSLLLCFPLPFPPSFFLFWRVLCVGARSFSPLPALFYFCYSLAVHSFVALCFLYLCPCAVLFTHIPLLSRKESGSTKPM
jgi:hypothetical protein